MPLTPGTRLGPYEVTAQATSAVPSIIVVENWLEELRRLVPTD